MYIGFFVGKPEGKRPREKTRLRWEDNCSGDKIEKNEMGWACGAYVGEEWRILGFVGETFLEIDHLEDPGVDGRIILRWILRK